MKETWKDVKGYEGQYQVSNLGHVRSLKFGKVRFLKPRRRKDGYLTVNLCRNSKERNVRIHRLVAEAFIPNPSNFPVINHKDENRTNNVVDNLEWCTQKYNVNYGTGQTRRATKLKGRFVNGPLAKAVLQYDKSGHLVREWPSTIEVQRQTGYAQSHISKCCLGKCKTAYGYFWKYK